MVWDGVRSLRRTESMRPLRISDGCHAIVSAPRVSSCEAHCPRLIQRTPLFHVSQNFVMPRSKPMLNANAPTKMLGTYTPAGRVGQSCPTLPLSLARVSVHATHCYASRECCRRRWPAMQSAQTRLQEALRMYSQTWLADGRDVRGESETGDRRAKASVSGVWKF